MRLTADELVSRAERIIAVCVRDPKTRTCLEADLDSLCEAIAMELTRTACEAAVDGVAGLFNDAGV